MPFLGLFSLGRVGFCVLFPLRMSSFPFPLYVSALFPVKFPLVASLGGSYLLLLCLCSSFPRSPPPISFFRRYFFRPFSFPTLIHFHRQRSSSSVALETCLFPHPLFILFPIDGQNRATLPVNGLIRPHSFSCEEISGGLLWFWFLGSLFLGWVAPPTSCSSLGLFLWAID